MIAICVYEHIHMCVYIYICRTWPSHWLQCTVQPPSLILYWKVQCWIECVNYYRKLETMSSFIVQNFCTHCLMESHWLMRLKGTFVVSFLLGIELQMTFYQHTRAPGLVKPTYRGLLWHSCTVRHSYMCCRPLEASNFPLTSSTTNTCTHLEILKGTYPHLPPIFTKNAHFADFFPLRRHLLL